MPATLAAFPLSIPAREGGDQTSSGPEQALVQTQGLLRGTG